MSLTLRERVVRLGRFCRVAARYGDMKTKNIAWMGAGLLLAGVAGVVWGRKRRLQAAVPAGSGPQPVEPSVEHAALQAILEASVAYNDSLYERVQALETVEDAEARPQAVAALVKQNQRERMEIDALREKLQQELAGQGRTFSDVDGFAELISEYRCKTLRQQKRHLVVYERVRQMKNMPPSPELHAYLKLGFKEEELRHADTVRRVQQLADEQRGVLLRAGRLLAGISNAGAAAAAPAELSRLGDRYHEMVEDIKLYREDDAETVAEVLPSLKTMYEGLLPSLRAQVQRLSEAGYYDDALLREVLERLLPLAK